MSFMLYFIPCVHVLGKLLCVCEERHMDAIERGQGIWVGRYVISDFDMS